MIALKKQLEQSKELLNALDKDYKARLTAEKRVAKQLSTLFGTTEKQILQTLQALPELPADFYSLTTPLDDLRVIYNQLIGQTTLTQFKKGYYRNSALISLMEQKLNLGNVMDALTIRGNNYFGIDQKILQNIKNKSFTASNGVMDRVKNTIMKNLAKSYNDGVGIDDAARNLQKEFAKLKGYEAVRIARTEINSSQNEGAFQAYYDFDIQYHQWWTGQDARVRDSHREIHGQITRVGSTFSNGLTRPGDRNGSKKEWIHCRCTTVPYLMPLGYMPPHGMTTFRESDLIEIPNFKQKLIEIEF